MTVIELKRMAKDRGLRGYSRLKKADLERMLGVADDRRTVRELQVAARQLQIAGRSRMNRAALVAAVQAAERQTARPVDLDAVIDECSHPSPMEIAASEREADTRAYLAALRTASLGRDYADALVLYQRHGERTPPQVVAVLDAASRLAWQRARDAAADRTTWTRRHHQYLRACGQV